MRTAAISHRVADFLKQHPPFQSMDEPDLLALVSRGRVRFHEVDEFLCWQNAGYAPFLFVIQRGAVSLWEEANGKDLLRDIRGPGDIIGVERLLGSPAYPYSAKANEDVIVYALDAGDFERLLAKYSHAERYVRSYASVGALSGHSTRESPNERFVVDLARHPEPFTCTPDQTVAEAARLMADWDTDAIAVMRDRTLEGLITSRDVVRWAAEGGAATDPAPRIMRGAPPTVAPHTTVAQCVLAMGRAGSRFAAMTADGTPEAGLLRIISAADLQPAFGDNPISLLDEIARARDIEVIRALHGRARAFVLAQLKDANLVEWLAEFACQVDAAIVRRLVELAGNARAGWTWCFFGAAGRRESLSATEPRVAVICDDGSETTAEQARLLLARDLEACGYIAQEGRERAKVALSGSPATWEQRFSGWINDPVRNATFAARPLFDLRPAFGAAEPWQRLRDFVAAAVSANANFQGVLANDCLSALPPLTFFEDEVIDANGDGSEVFRIERNAIAPVVDVARVFGMATGTLLGSSTTERMDAARRRMPADDRILRDALDTFRVLLYLQARTGLRLHNDGSEMLASQLSRFDQQVLKSGFRAIHALLEFTIARVWKDAD